MAVAFDGPATTSSSPWAFRAEASCLRLSWSRRIWFAEMFCDARKSVNLQKRACQRLATTREKWRFPYADCGPRIRVDRAGRAAFEAAGAADGAAFGGAEAEEAAFEAVGPLLVAVCGAAWEGWPPALPRRPACVARGMLYLWMTILVWCRGKHVVNGTNASSRIKVRVFSLTDC